MATCYSNHLIGESKSRFTSDGALYPQGDSQESTSDISEEIERKEEESVDH
jgi:hypothetical protein